MRESSDYEIGVVFSKDEVKILIKNAGEFLGKSPRIHKGKTLD